jgi:hypothetical protein
MRTEQRKKNLGEVFTPSELVTKILARFPEESWTDPNKKLLDPTCGNGNFLIGFKIFLSKYHSLDNITSRVYGADIMEDNCRDSISRLYELDLSDIETINLNEIVEEHFSWIDIPSNLLFLSPSQRKELQRYNTHLANLEALPHAETIKKFLRPGLIALFLNKKNKHDYSNNCAS